jgi:hypothetical protein
MANSRDDLPPTGNYRDPSQMIHDMKTEARKTDPYEPFDSPTSGVLRSAARTNTPRIDPSTWSDEDITSADMSLASGVYEGAGGYEYEVLPGGEIKILQAPGGRGVGLTLKHGHPAHEAIFDELSESGAGPKSAAPVEEPERLGATMAERASRNLIGGVKPDDETIAGGGSPHPEPKPSALAKK